MITNNDIKSLAHTKWNCKYHIVFAPKFRRKVFYESKRLEIGKMIRELCKWKEVNLIEGEVCLDHVHILVEIPPKLSVLSFMGFLKGKTSIMIYQKYGNMKHEVGANQACLNLLACRPTKCQLNEVKAKHEAEK